MSSGLECECLDLGGQWFWILQSWSCPAECWNWREEDPDMGGPFASEDEAWEDLRSGHANPGGYSIVRMLPEDLAADPVRAGLVARAMGKPYAPPPRGAQPEEISAYLRFPLIGAVNPDLPLMAWPSMEDPVAGVQPVMLTEPCDTAAVCAVFLPSVQVSRDALALRITLREFDPVRRDEVEAMMEKVMKSLLANVARSFPDLPVALRLVDGEGCEILARNLARATEATDLCVDLDNDDPEP